MKILVLTHYMNGEFPTTVFVQRQIIEYAKQGCKVKVIVFSPYIKKDYFGKRFGDSLKIITADNIEFITLRYFSFSKYGKNGFNVNSAQKAIDKYLSKYIKDFNPDIIHAHTIGFEGSLGVKMKEKYDIPLVITTHGSDATIPIVNKKTDKLVDICSKSDLVVAVSSKLKKMIESVSSSIKMNIIYNGFPQKIFIADSIKKPYTFMQVGNLIKQKNVDLTIRAFAKIKEKHSQATLSIVGKGPELEHLIKLCNDLGIRSSVNFCGQMPNDLVLEMMSETEFFIMPSIREGFGVVYIEAMANGCITIGTEGEGISEIIVSEENGFLVKANDYMDIVTRVDGCIDDEPQKEEIRRKAQESVSELTWEKNALNYIQLFEKLIQNNNAKRRQQ